MITIPLKRDEARIIEKTFLPYMISVLRSRLNSYPSGTNKYLRYMIFLSLINDLEWMFKRKLRSDTKKFTFKLSDAHGITFYILLMKQPIKEDLVYANMLRQNICNKIHQQFLQPALEIERLSDKAQGFYDQAN